MAESYAGKSADLLPWWQTEFTTEEQNYIFAKCGEPLIHPDGSLALTHFRTLANVATWFTTGDDISLARRILAKSVELKESETGSFEERHFIYHAMIQIYYRDRTRDPDALTLAIQACKSQIAIAPQLIRKWPKEWKWAGRLPAHTGFEQLAIILEKGKDYDSAIRLSEKALRQGWAGDLLPENWSRWSVSLVG